MKTKDNGWRTYYSVSNSDGHRAGNMKCNKCGGDIKGDFLIEEKQNFLHRGNETDEMYLYHRECSSDNEKWIEYDKKNDKRKAYFDKREAVKSELLKKIKEYDFDAEELFDLDYIKSHIW